MARQESIRTPLGKVRGLGSAKHGAAHFVAQRVSAIALLFLVPWFMISLIVFSAVTGCLMIAKGMMDNQKFGAVIENSQSIYSYSQLKYLSITAFTTGLAKELSVNFELGGKVLSDPRTVLRNFKVEQSVNCLHLEYL